MNYHWPGNVRELKNVVERVVIMSAGEWIGLEDLPGAFRRGGDGSRGDVFGLASLDEARDAFEKKFIERKLEESAYDIAKTAERIGIDEGELRRKAEGFGIRWERNQT
jgi:two-component system nitrogen regulation response regulator NtrX